MTAMGTRNSPIHPLAKLTFAASVLAIFLAVWGSVDVEKRIVNNPLMHARSVGMVEAGESSVMLPLLAFGVPLVLGVAVVASGGRAMLRIEQGAGRFRGDAVAVFGMLLGGLAAVIGGCMAFALFVWPRLPNVSGF